MTYSICEPCIDVKDRACVDECPVDCIYEGGRMLALHPGARVACTYECGRWRTPPPAGCLACGACEPVCPVTAIFYEDDVPAEWKNYNQINAEFFADSVSGIGSPGGAAQVGAVARDHPFVSAFQAPE